MTWCVIKNKIIVKLKAYTLFRGKPFRRRAKHTNQDSLDDVNMDDDDATDDDVPDTTQNSTRHSRKFCDTSGGV